MSIAPFELTLPSRVTFGAGLSVLLPEIVAGFGTRVLVVTGSSPQRVDHLVAPLRAGADAVDLVTVAGEPTTQDARVAADAGRALRAQVVVAIGGGSAIDLGKAAAMLLANGGDPMDYIEVVGRGLPIVADPFPLVAVPTTSGTGAEVTANAVLAVLEHGVKASLRHPRMVPRHALVDPVLTLDCPPAVTAASGMDALTQCLEPYVSRLANPVSDGWARAGLLLGGRGLLTAFCDGSDLPARSDMALCSLLGGLALTSAKLGAVHGFAGVLGGMSEAPHGAVCAALLAPVCRANIARADAPLRARYADAASLVTGVPDASPEQLVDWIEAACAELGIPPLSDYGLRADQTEEVVAKATRASSMAGNPVVLSAEELSGVFRAAL